MRIADQQSNSPREEIDDAAWPEIDQDTLRLVTVVSCSIQVCHTVYRIDKYRCSRSHY